MMKGVGGGRRRKNGERERVKHRRKLENLVCAIRKISLLIKISSYSWPRTLRGGWKKMPNSNILNDFYDFSLFTSIFYLRFLSLYLPHFPFTLAIFQLASQRQGFIDIKKFVLMSKQLPPA
jgi:hypothetical protein